MLNGTEINWSDYGTYGIMSIALAIVCILLWFISLLKLKDRVYSIGKYLCIFIILIQVVTIGVVWIRDVVTGEDQAQDMLNLLQGEDAEEYRELFGGGFTFYPDTLGAYPTTKAAVPHILTGAWYYNEKPYAEYIQDAYRNSPILESLRANNFRWDCIRRIVC